MRLRRRSSVEAEIDPRQFVGSLRKQIDEVESGGLFAHPVRTHPYIGRVERDAFTVRKRVGQPWDHFKAWVLGWAYVAVTIGLFCTVAVIAARDIVDGGLLEEWTPQLFASGLVALSGLIVLLVLRFAGSVAEEDSAELDSLIRFSTEVAPTPGLRPVSRLERMQG